MIQYMLVLSSTLASPSVRRTRRNIYDYTQYYLPRISTLTQRNKLSRTSHEVQGRNQAVLN